MTYVNFISLIELEFSVLYSFTMCQLTRWTILKAAL